MEKKRRVPRGYTREPWPCCQKAADEEVGRPKGRICGDCEALMLIGAEARQRRADAGEQTYLWAERPHWWPRYYGPYAFTRTDTGEMLADAMYALVGKLCTPTETYSGPERPEYLLRCKAGSSHYEHTTEVSADPAVRERLDALDAAIRRALAEAYAAGRGRGQNIVLQLATGDLSLADFEDAESKRRRQQNDE